VTRYAHLQSISVYENQVVLQGQPIGKCGSTGNSDNCHIHFVLYYKGQSIRPEPMGAYQSFIEGRWYTSSNNSYLQFQSWDDKCKTIDPDLLVERFRGESGNIEVNATPFDNRLYYYTDTLCQVSYHPFYDIWSGGGSPCLGESDCDANNNSLGPGQQTFASEFPEDGLPDFVTTKAWTGQSEEEEDETYKFRSLEKMCACCITENVGDIDSPDDIKVMFLLSDGYKEDLHSDWKQVGELQNIRYYNLERGMSHKECVCFQAPEAPRVYNIVACADRTETQDNEDGDVLEKHKSNNCSTEAVFTVFEFPPPHENIAWIAPIINYLLK